MELDRTSCEVLLVVVSHRLIHDLPGTTRLSQAWASWVVQFLLCVFYSSLGTKNVYVNILTRIS